MFIEFSSYFVFDDWWLVLFDFKFKCNLSTECFVVNSKSNLTQLVSGFGCEHLEIIYFTRHVALAFTFNCFPPCGYFFVSFSTFFSFLKKNVFYYIHLLFISIKITEAILYVYLCVSSGD